MADKKDNMALWNAVWQSDPDYTKEVKYGARHFTTLEAYRQVMAATKMWGPVGKGWGWTARFHTAQAEDKDGKFTVGWCVMELWHETREQSLTTTGGAAVDRKGEWEKKALTDAITKGLSYLGFNADVFLGMFDDNKYVEERREACKNDHRPSHSGDPSAAGGHATDSEIASAASLKAFHARGTEICTSASAWDQWRPQVVAWASSHRVESSAQMTQAELSRALDYMDQSHVETKTGKG